MPGVTGLMDDSDSDGLDDSGSVQAPRWLVVFDDLSHRLRHPCIAKLAKERRHYNMRCIYSSQHTNDCRPETIKQMSVVCIWPGQSLDKLKKIYRDCDIGISPMDFVCLYRDATREPHNFLFCDVRKNRFRKNLDEEYVKYSAVHKIKT